MSNETDLDWLAQNVHVWPAGDHQPWCYVYMVAGGAMKASGNFLDAVAYPEMVTKDQWLARRAELQSVTEQFKPSIEEANRLAQEFKLFTSIEDNQGQEMKQNNGWFERGDLPPVGSQCEVMHRDSWVVCGVIAHFQQKAAMVAAYTVDNGNALKSLDSCIAKYFRPIPTERDVLADLIESHGQMSALIVADAILAAGFKMEAK